MKKKIECRMHTENGEFYDYVKVVSKASTKFKLERDYTLAVVDRLLTINRKARESGRNVNSRAVIDEAITVLKEELNDYVEFKEYDAINDRWVAI